MDFFVTVNIDDQTSDVDGRSDVTETAVDDAPPPAYGAVVMSGKQQGMTSQQSYTNPGYAQLDPNSLSMQQQQPNMTSQQQTYMTSQQQQQAYGRTVIITQPRVSLEFATVTCFFAFIAAPPRLTVIEINATGFNQLSPVCFVPQSNAVAPMGGVYVEPKPTGTIVGAIVYSCFVTWCCWFGCLCGIPAFIVACKQLPLHVTYYNVIVT